MSAGQEELMDEQDAAQQLGISPEHLRELATQGELRVVLIQRASNELEPMYLTGEVLRLKENLRGQESESETQEEWPDMIDE